MSAYEERVIELEELGCTTSDAQSVADCEVLAGKIQPSPEAQASAKLYAKWKLSRDARLAKRSGS